MFNSAIFSLTFMMHRLSPRLCTTCPFATSYSVPTFSVWKIVDQDQNFGGTTVSEAPLSTVNVNFSHVTSLDITGVS